MIINLARFIEKEKPFWEELQSQLDRRDNDHSLHCSVDEIKRFYYLYKRACSGLIRLRSDANEPLMVQYLEELVSRAYREIYGGTLRRKIRLRPLTWFFSSFPFVVRKHRHALLYSLVAFLIGGLIGASVLMIDKNARFAILPHYLQMSPAERVKDEERQNSDRLLHSKATFSSFLATHNIQVSIFTFALGMSWGIGTLIMLFFNGFLLGAVAYDYYSGGQIVFLLGWLLPHGVIEIPSILIAGQAGIVLGTTLIGKGSVYSLGKRFRDVSKELVSLVGGCACLLLWAGVVESFISQYHQPSLPYAVKITFGVVEMVLLLLLLSTGGRNINTKNKRESTPGSLTISADDYDRP
ncbi:MAG: stage II sporulation protein M [Chitinivibrionales bacterium]|nr:stage II sporulation protein M [Chitinivibrionales bacterium]